VRARATVLGAALALACAGGSPPYELPEERTGGRPLTQAPNPRSGEISWRAGPIEKTPDGLRVEFTLMNGTSRDYFNVMLRLVLRGPEREVATVRYPTGSLGARSTKRIQAHLASPGFEVEAAQLELIWAQE
jgi:hypothetical protein